MKIPVWFVCLFLSRCRHDVHYSTFFYWPALYPLVSTCSRFAVKVPLALLLDLFVFVQSCHKIYQKLLLTSLRNLRANLVALVTTYSPFAMMVLGFWIYLLFSHHLLPLPCLTYSRFSKRASITLQTLPNVSSERHEHNRQFAYIP